MGGTLIIKIDPYRLLNFAFSSADLFVEVGDEGALGFALGAGQKVLGRAEASLAGVHWRKIIARRDQPLVEAVLASLGQAERRGPFNIGVVDPAGEERYVAFSVGRLPPLQTVSMCFSISPADGVAFTGTLLSGAEFVKEAERVLERDGRVGGGLGLSLVQFSGLQSARSGLSPSEISALDEKIVGAVRAQTYAGALAGQLGPESYAFIRPAFEDEAVLTERLNRSLRAMVSDLLDVSAVVTPVRPGEVSEGASPALALKRAINLVTQKGAPAGQSLAEAFSRSVELTLTEAASFKATVSGRKFHLAFQPVVSLGKRAVHHHEVLVRFDRGKSPLDTILMAEELDLIEALDRAIVMETLEVLTSRPGNLKLAVNVSGRTICDADFVTWLRGEVKRAGGAAHRLLIEVTESSKIEDFDRVDRHMQMLRKDGHVVCLDDFGAGAASLAYLQRLHVDIVKVDGQYIRNLTSSRDRAMVKHVVDMCKGLGVSTIAEMVETEEMASAVREAGFDFAQGYLFGRPEANPEQAIPSPAPVAARRRGVVESWG